MEIQKENHLLEQFEKTKTFKRFFSTLLRFDEELDCFIATEKWRDKEAELLTAAWWMFAEVATAQPVPESFEKAYSEIFSPIVKRPYPRLENGDYKYIEIDQGWKLWQAATAQAVPEGFVLVDKHQLAQLMANMDSFGKKALGDDYVSFADIAAVLDEAQEQK
ncbi:hypothetical protein [Acinetobacter johnsonii]|uniref:hypothetical protein n=1 Tax=Acinetobacter johnsonii TaxID=40214 RepID=UPI0007B41C97|nr:hypothetical protein [Acinetobacter johnsonii]